MNAVLAATLLALLAACCCAQAAAAPSSDNAVLQTTSTTAVVSKLRCYLEAASQVIAFAADIPRNCLDLARRSDNPLYVFPACVVYSIGATYQLSTIVFKECNDA